MADRTVYSRDWSVRIFRETKKREEKKAAANAALQDALSKVKVFAIDDEMEINVPLYQPVADSRPAVGEPFTVYMGDRMTQQRSGVFASCITPVREVRKQVSGQEFFMKANVPVCKDEEKAKVYTPKYINARTPDEYVLDMTTKKGKNGTKVCWKFGFFSSCSEELSPAELMQGKAFISYEGSVQRSIEYAGKHGSVVKFLYTEYDGDMIRSGFTREFEVDLAEGGIGAYKGLVFEVIDANNATITYKMIRHFPELD